MKIGFIGTGNMGSAIIGGLIAKGTWNADDIYAYDVNADALNCCTSQYGIHAVADSNTLVANTDVVVLSIKPQFYEDVINEIRDAVDTQKHLILTIAPKSIAWVEEVFAKPIRMVRAMPNTPALVGEGITGVCPNANATKDDVTVICDLFSCCGKVEQVPEHLMDVVTAVSGSSPAYVFMFIEAMADAAVADGMPRAQAYQFAAQAVLGSAKMVLETGKHPGELKDMVCSPGGTTIEAVRVLEEKGMRSAVIEGMKACVRKSRGL